MVVKIFYQWRKRLKKRFEINVTSVNPLVDKPSYYKSKSQVTYKVVWKQDKCSVENLHNFTLDVEVRR